MPILHDNRNMRPDLLDTPVESVDDIFSAADANMESQRQKQLFAPVRKKTNWKKKIKRTIIGAIVFVVVLFLIAGIISAKMAYTRTRTEIQNQVLAKVTAIKEDIDGKDESELTEEELFAKAILEILTEDDIVNIIQTATSVEEIVAIFETGTVDVNRYLTVEQQKQLEAALEEYAATMEERAEEWEQEFAEESPVLEEPAQTTAQEPEVVIEPEVDSKPIEDTDSETSTENSNT